MQTLASFFVSLVIIANTLFPKSDIPHVLGVSIAEGGSDSTESLFQTPKPPTTFSPTSGTNETHDLAPRINTQELKDRSLLQMGRDAIQNTRERIRTTFDLKENDSSEGGRPDREHKLAEIKLKRDEFKTKLTEIHDENKKERLTSLDTNFTKINAKAVENFGKVLDRLSAILDKIKARTDEAATAGKNVTSILAAINTAEGKITDARAAVADQADNSYVIDITSEDKLGPSASSTVQTMRTDIKGVGSKVKDAVQSVKDVFKAVKLVVGETEPTATPVATP